MSCAFWQCVRSACSGGGRNFRTVDVNPRIRVWYLGLVCVHRHVHGVRFLVFTPIHFDVAVPKLQQTLALPPAGGKLKKSGCKVVW